MPQYVPCQNCGRMVNRYLDVCPYCDADPGADGGDRPEVTSSPGKRDRERYLPIASVSLFVQLLLGLFIAASLVSILTALPYRGDLLDIAAGLTAGAEAVALSEDRYNTALLLVTFAYLATSLTFITWFWRAYSNLTFLQRSRKRRPGWALGGWFIPIAGMIIPYGIGAEIWTQSKPEPGPIKGDRDTNMEPVISWWALFLIMSVVNVVESFILPEDYTASDLAAFVGVDMIASIVAIAAAVATIRFVRMATDRQERLLALRQSGLAGL